MVRVRITVKVRVSVLVRVSIRTSWVVNFALLRCYRLVIYTRPDRRDRCSCLLNAIVNLEPPAVLHANCTSFIGNWTLRRLDISPTTWTLRLLDISPTGQFA